jgi:uncharacterized protein (TIGR03084 family)
MSRPRNSASLDVLRDLRDEGDELEAVVTTNSGAWRRPTAAPGWTIAHQVSHLEWTDNLLLTALGEPERFAEVVGQLPVPLTAAVDAAAASGALRDQSEALRAWQRSRGEVLEQLSARNPSDRVPWLDSTMSVRSAATARLMETWAHGQDIADGLGIRRTPSGRLRHVAHLAVSTRDYSFALHGLPAPTEEFRVELDGPAGQSWEWGPPDAPQRVTGPALDFCLLAVRRQPRAEVKLTAVGEQADTWLTVIQAFAGPSRL